MNLIEINKQCSGFEVSIEKLYRNNSSDFYHFESFVLKSKNLNYVDISAEVKTKFCENSSAHWVKLFSNEKGFRFILPKSRASI